MDNEDFIIWGIFVFCVILLFVSIWFTIKSLNETEDIIKSCLSPIAQDVCKKHGYNNFGVENNYLGYSIICNNDSRDYNLINYKFLDNETRGCKK